MNCHSKLAAHASRSARGQFGPVPARISRSPLPRAALCALGSLALLSLGQVNAQTAAQPSAAASATANGTEEVVRLNPFEVTSENDKGFQSGSVGTTARMKVDLADTPVSYSIINREFIDALGITDMAEAAAWATNQSFLSTNNGGLTNNSSQQFFQRGQVVSTGAASGTGAQRNSFQTANQINDSYNVESFDFGRGPNAALFGSGSGGGGLGGISSTQTKKARLDAPRTTISVVTGSWNYRRATIDYNRPLTERVGIRINAVALNGDGWRQRESFTTRGLTGTLTWKITNTTDFTLEASHEMKQAHVVGNGYDDHASGWDGVTVFRGPITNAMFSTNGTVGATSSGGSQVFGVNPITGSTGLTFNGEPNGVTRLNGPFLMADLMTGTLMNYQNQPVTVKADTTSRTPLWSRTAPNGLYFVRAGNGSLPLQGNGAIQPSFGVGRQTHYATTKQGLPADMWYRAEENSTFRQPSYRFTGTIDTPTTWSWSKSLQTTLTQRVGQNLFFDLSADINRVHSAQQTFDQPSGGTPEGGRNEFIDINQISPDGTPNRHYLEPYTSLNPGPRNDYTADQGIRLNAVYTNLDLKKWGNYTFNVQGGASQRDSETVPYALVAAVNADPRRWNTTDQIRIRTNWYDPVKTYYVPTALNFTGNVDWANFNAPVIRPTTVAKPRMILGQAQGVGGSALSKGFDQDRFYLAHTQAKYFNGGLVVTADYRRAFAYRIRKAGLAQGDLPANWDAMTAYYLPDAPADYFKMTYLSKNTVTGAVLNTKPILAITRPRTTDPVSQLSIINPVFANDRFRNDYNAPSTRTYSDSKNLGLVWNATKSAAPYLNYSTSYTPPSSTALDINLDRIKPLDAYGYDMGVNLRLLKGNLTMRLNYYKNTRKNNAQNSPVFTPINQLYQSNRFDDADSSASGRNALGIDDLNSNGDYADLRSDGREVEIGANLFHGLRLTLNGGWGFQTSSNANLLSKAYVPAHTADFLKILQDAGGKLDTTQKPIGAPSAPGLAVVDPSVAGPLLDQQLAINAYNNLWINYQSMVTSNNLRTPNQPVINGFLDYTLQSGVAKGLRMGAGVQWQGSTPFATLGSRTILDPSNPIPTAIDDPSVDNNNFSYLKGSYKSTATLAYTFQLKNRASLGLNLVVSNPINDRGVDFVDASRGPNSGSALRQPGGDLTLPNRAPLPSLVSRIKEPISYKLTGTYSFGGSR
jgi:outer membrane receptor protein involved in Fe transport